MAAISWGSPLTIDSSIQDRFRGPDNSEMVGVSVHTSFTAGIQIYRFQCFHSERGLRWGLPLFSPHACGLFPLYSYLCPMLLHSVRPVSLRGLKTAQKTGVRWMRSKWLVLSKRVAETNCSTEISVRIDSLLKLSYASSLVRFSFQFSSNIQGNSSQSAAPLIPSPPFTPPSKVPVHL